MYKLISVLFLGLILIAGCAKQDKNVIKVALAGPLTGDIAAMGQGMKKAIEIAVEEANQSGVLKDKKFQAVIFDDRADPKEAVSVANQIVSDPQIYGIVGHLNSGCSIPASQIYAKYNLVIITPASTNPKLTQQGLKNVFRVCTTDDVQGSAAANYVIDKLKIKNVSIIHDKTPYGQGIAENFKATFENRKDKVLSYDGINTGDKDFKALLTKIKTFKPQLIYFGGVYSEYGLLSKQAKELGLNAVFFSDDGSSSPEYIKIAGSASEGNYVSMIGIPPAKLKKAKAFLDTFASKYPGTDLQPYDTYTYETSKILIDAIVKTNMDKSKIADYLATVKFDGILGITSFDANGDTLNKSISIYKAKNGKFEYCE
ncbi:MAG: hypothetical protein A2252_08225 [Elusimicrobia bacterium RIFOXYA2_FULL_39_19]|nr:MAG: hypothetical protein A2252_08225 [Elusimicrobia bacterium RIFOXYA2_FULL_39_19]